ncbi:serine/threonine-protein kinase [Streptomyces sp. NRRL B-3648]|uniref:serine/threonine-protein kinase n=1 Tax=Streptomyces sp. NRRL B-3648 TaxID=1519493 RepID=UPI000A3EE376|nr:serine/threonine-protein kinase [Streptomyces sp. NRRL B-3648]
MQPLESTDPAVIGGYPLLARLGAGGMGQVYLSRTPAGRPLALKTVRPDLTAAPDFETRFAREIRTSDRVRSPWTVSVVDFSPPGHRPQWLATEYIAAPALADWVTAHGPLPPATLRLLAGELAAALAAVHACGLTHRDVKPSNVLLGRARPMLIDFGIARAADDSHHTGTGGVIGSPGYLAPEQAVQGTVTEAGDVFSLGAVLAFAATGTGPFQLPGEQPSAPLLLYRIVHEDARLDGVPAGLAQLVARCLAKNPDDRPRSAELAASLRGEGGVGDPRAAAYGPGTTPGAGAWERALPPGLAADLLAREAEVARRCAAPPDHPASAARTAPGPDIPGAPTTAGAVVPPSAGRPVPDTAAPYPPSATAGSYPPGPPGGHTGPAISSSYGAHHPVYLRGRRRVRRLAAACALTVAAVTTGILLMHPFDTTAHGDGTPSSRPLPSASAPALSAKWAGVWTGTGPGTPQADGQLHPRTDSFKVTLTLHTAAVGELAGKQVSNITEVGTGREVGCTEALTLRAVRGTTATFEAATSHPTDRSDTSLQCETGHLYVVQLTDADTITLGEEGAQSAGAPESVHRSRRTS